MHCDIPLEDRNHIEKNTDDRSWATGTTTWKGAKQMVKAGEKPEHRCGLLSEERINYLGGMLQTSE